MIEGRSFSMLDGADLERRQVMWTSITPGPPG